jgi:hypothetical protein
MMRVFAIIIAVILVLVIGGGLTAQIAQQGGSGAIPVFVQQTENPDASVFETVPWKAEQLFLLVGFIVFNMMGIGVTIALIMWFLNRQVASAKKSEGPQRETPSSSAAETS